MDTLRHIPWWRLTAYAVWALLTVRLAAMRDLADALSAVTILALALTTEVLDERLEHERAKYAAAIAILSAVGLEYDKACRQRDEAQVSVVDLRLRLATQGREWRNVPDDDGDTVHALAPDRSCSVCGGLHRVDTLDKVDGA